MVILRFPLNHRVSHGGLYFPSSALLNFLAVHMDAIGRAEDRKSRLLGR